MTRSSSTADRPVPKIDLGGLDAEQLDLIAKFVDLVRSPEKERVRAEFTRFWNSWKASAPVIPDQEAEDIVVEAVAFARSRA